MKSQIVTIEHFCQKRFWGQMPFVLATSAKDIHCNSSFLQPPTDLCVCWEDETFARLKEHLLDTVQMPAVEYLDSIWVWEQKRATSLPSEVCWWLKKGWVAVDVFSTGWWQEGHPVKEDVWRGRVKENWLYQVHLERWRFNWHVYEGRSKSSATRP